MLFDRVVHHAVLANCFVEGGEEGRLLIVVMLFHTLVPGEAVAYEIGPVGWANPGCLLVNAVETADEGVVAQGHVRALFGESICLAMSVSRGTHLRERLWPTSPVSNVGVWIRAKGVSWYSGVAMFVQRLEVRSESQTKGILSSESTIGAGRKWIERKETSVSEMIKVKSLCQCLLIEVLIKMREWCKLR